MQQLNDRMAACRGYGFRAGIRPLVLRATLERMIDEQAQALGANDADLWVAQHPDIGPRSRSEVEAAEHARASKAAHSAQQLEVLNRLRVLLWAREVLPEACAGAAGAEAQREASRARDARRLRAAGRPSITRACESCGEVSPMPLEPGPRVGGLSWEIAECVGCGKRHDVFGQDGEKMGGQA